MKNRLIYRLILLSFLASPGGLGKAREFTDAKGRKIEAELVGHSGKTVIISRGGKEFPVAVSAFSLDDQQYIQTWISENPEAARFKFGFYADLERERGVNQRDAPGGAYEDKLKTTAYSYEMIVYNKGIAPAESVDIRYEIYIHDYVDVVNNRFTRLAVGGTKEAKLQTIAGKISDLDIPASGRHDFKRTFNTQFYIDRDGGRTDEAAQDKILGVRIRVYKGEKVLGEFLEGEDDHEMKDIKWQDAAPTEGAGPTERG